MNPDTSVLEQLFALGQIATALALGGMVGAERARAAKAAGLRTHMLVAGAAALVIILGEIALSENGVVGDSTRSLHAIITGIGFLGGGAIVRDSTTGQSGGLTTAASVLFVAAVGSACGFGQIVLAIGSTILALGTLRGMKTLERAARRQYRKNKEQNPEDVEDEDV